jgi:hypothetical protein
MDLRQLRYFVAVAEEGHITRAAERLGMQQPPLSQQIKAIEQELDLQLFRRKARGVELTDAGRVLFDQARAVLERLDHALLLTRRTARGEQGRLSAWGGNPETDALYLNVTPSQNDGRTVYKLSVKDVPVDGFWSISLYNAQGYYEPNPYNAYSINNITAAKGGDGGVSIQFGGCDGKVVNCLPIMSGWNYMVRLYRPWAEVLNGTWKFPEAQPVN